MKAVRFRQGQWIFDLAKTSHPMIVYEVTGSKKLRGELMVNALAWQSTTPHKYIAPGETVALLEKTHTLAPKGVLERAASCLRKDRHHG